VHFNQVVCGSNLKVLPKPKAFGSLCRQFEPHHSPHPRVKAVSSEQISGVDASRHNLITILLKRIHSPSRASDPQFVCPRGERGVQGCAPHPAPFATRKAVVDLPGGVAVTDSSEGVPGRVDPQPRECRHRPGHESFSAGFIDGRCSWFDHGHGEAAQPCFYRGGQADGPTADHQNIHWLAHAVREAIALSSTGMR
jgi:hypothetical protein